MNTIIKSIRLFTLAVAALAIAMLSGCCGRFDGSVRTLPANLAAFGAISGDNSDGTSGGTSGGGALVSRPRPLARFPAKIAVAHINDGRQGGYDLASYQPPEVDKRIRALRRLPMVVGVVTLNRLHLGPDAVSDVQLRQAAAQADADLLLVYTFDSATNQHDLAPPVGLATLGMAPNHVVSATSSAHALLVDTRTGYRFASAEASGKDWTLADGWSRWNKQNAVIAKADVRSFDKLMDDFARGWNQVLYLYAGTARH